MDQTELAGFAGVTIEDLRFNDRPVRDAAAARLTLGPNVHGVQFVPPAVDGSGSP